jgi:AP-3 complex subunit mu
MLDSGYPLTTEPNALRDIVTPPSFFKKILAVAGSAGLVPSLSASVTTASAFDTIPTRIAKVVSTPFSSPIPWRATGLRYNTNEIFFDLVEDLDCILSKYVSNHPLLSPLTLL